MTISGSQNLVEGDSSTYTVTYAPTNATNIGTTTWSVDNSSIASISASGVLTTTGDGTVIVTATNGSVTSTHTVTIAEDVALDQYSWPSGQFSWPQAATRYTPNLDGLANYYKLDTPIALTGNFYFSGYFTIDGSTYLAGSKDTATGRLLYSESNTAFFVSLNNSNSTVTSIDVSIFSGKGVYFIECYRINDIIYWKVNGVQQGSGAGRSGTIYIDSFGTQWSESTSVPYHSGYMYDITLGNSGNTEFFSLNNPYSDYPSNIFGSKGTRLTGYNFVASQIESTPVGIELLKNNTFEDGLTSWSPQGAAVAVDTTTPGTVAVTTSNFEGIYQAFPTEVGKTYKVKWKTLSKVNTLFLRVYDTSSFGTLVKEVTSDALEGFLTFTAVSDYSNLYLRNTTAGTTVWDEVSVMEMDI
jgi:hypothetical protein